MKLRLQDLGVRGKKVLLRVDFNVPFDASGAISDDTRIRAALPTIRFILDQGGSVILMSHLGRPEGKRSPKFSLAPCAKALAALLNKPVQMASDCIGPDVEKEAEALKSGEVLLLENLRFHAAEEKPSLDPTFAKQLAQLGDLYVNDAFGTAHRAHASTAEIAAYFPKKAAAGLLLQKEIEFLGTLLTDPKRPFYAVIGGAKISTKIGVLSSLLKKVDGIFIGGGMAYPFFKAQGISIGDSPCEEDQVSVAAAFLKEAKEKQVPLWLPIDVVTADAFSQEAHVRTVSVQEGIAEKWQGMDMGPLTCEAWSKELQKAATVFWNGPVGVFEMPPFAKGTEAIAKCLATLSAITVVGGGDSLAAISKLHLEEHFTHLSTGGGAALEYIEYGHLPGIDALSPA
ncbi:MAG: phosphoglycerate kinase [Verrucomicrobia bacterium]|nr:phosphoglycerate kinase [Verrucomicrobiota bacterium]